MDNTTNQIIADTIQKSSHSTISSVLGYRSARLLDIDMALSISDSLTQLYNDVQTSCHITSNNRETSVNAVGLVNRF